MSDTSISNTAQPHPDYYKFTALFELRPDGVLINKVPRGKRAKVGEAIGGPDAEGYLRATVSGTKHLCHRIVYLLTYGRWPDGALDHIDGDRRNNAPGNLREVSNQTNSQNRSVCRNPSGYLGVYQPAGSTKWIAVARDPVAQKPVRLGRFGDPAEAHEAYMAYRRAHYAGHVEMHAPVYGGAL